MKEIKSEARLTLTEATSMIIGHGVGAGILSVPYLASRNRWQDFVWIVIVVYLLNLLLHLMIAELSYNNNGAQFIKCFENELFTGKLKRVFTWLAFALLGFSVLVNVSGFITGAAAVIVSWFGISQTAAKLLFYVAAAAVVFFGMKLVGICEKFAVLAMFVVIAILMGNVLAGNVLKPSMTFVSGNNILALYSMISFSLSAVMSVPQVVKGLNGDVRKVRISIAAGTGINLLMILLVTLMTLLGTGASISQNGALVDLSEKLGGWAGIIGYVFSLLALATSFWVNTLNLRDIVNEQLKLGTRLCWAVASIPSLGIALLGITSFVGFTRLAGVVQVLTGVGVIVAYNRSRRREKVSPVCGVSGRWIFQVIVIAGSLVSTVGSLLKVM